MRKRFSKNWECHNSWKDTVIRIDLGTNSFLKLKSQCPRLSKQCMLHLTYRSVCLLPVLRCCSNADTSWFFCNVSDQRFQCWFLVILKYSICPSSFIDKLLQFRNAVLVSTFVWNRSLNIDGSENCPFVDVRSSVDETVVNLNDRLCVSLTFRLVLTTFGLHTVFTPWPIW